MKTFIYLILTFLLSVIISTPYCSECENWQQDHPDWLWCDDFESGAGLNDNYQDVSTNGMSVTTDDAFEGTHSLCQQYTPGQVDAGWISRIDNDGYPDHVFMRWYHKFESNFEGFPPKMARIRYRHHTGDWKTIFAIHCWLENDGHLAADVYAENSSQANSSGWLPIAISPFTFAEPGNVDRWICFEMEVLVNTSGNTDGAYRFWANDTLIVERENVDLKGNTSDNINEFMLDCYWNDGSPKEQNRYYDNLVISTQKIGLYSGINNISNPLIPHNKLSNIPEMRIVKINHQKIAFYVEAIAQNTFLSIYTTTGKKIHTIPFVQTSYSRHMAVLDTSPFTITQGIYIAVLENTTQKIPYTLIVAGTSYYLKCKL